ncbi:hypothetical protein BJX68DRAFT_262065 [Aspergillus pseudodeflectus]|uniref:Oxidase ustYa n=1 Tax=Aspergillus pseudodeflectus TaxID=176178 RepID=A0ABR4L540_9EURO
MAPFCDGDGSSTKKVPLLGDMDMMSYSLHRASSDLEEAKYNIGEHDEHLGPSCSEAKSPSRKRTALYVVQIIALFAIAFLLGFVIGEAKTPQPQWKGGLLCKVLSIYSNLSDTDHVTVGFTVPAGTVHTALYHNLTFTQRPDAEAEQALGDLVPVGRGFVQHPELAPAVSTLTVFHQLHCLHAILAAYYAATEAADPALRPAFKADTDDPRLNNTGILMEPSHVRHCFDYLRQTIMCAADTNLEVLDRDTRATDGWGQERVCRDYQSVFDWADKWADPLDRSRGVVS